MKPRELWNKVTRKLHISLQKEKKPHYVFKRFLHYKPHSGTRSTWIFHVPASLTWSDPGQYMSFVPQPLLERIIPLDFAKVADSGLRLYGTSIPLSTIKQGKGWRILPLRKIYWTLNDFLFYSNNLFTIVLKEVGIGFF